MMQRRISGNAREKMDLGEEKEIRKSKKKGGKTVGLDNYMDNDCLLYTSPSPRERQ